MSISKKIEKYRGKTILLEPKQENELHELNCARIIGSNIEQINKLGFVPSKENKMVDMFLMKKIIDNLNSYNSKDKINLIFQNEKFPFDYMFEKSQETIHAIKNFWLEKNFKPQGESFLTYYKFPKEYISFLKTQYSYQRELQKRRLLNMTGSKNKTEEQLQLEACEIMYEEIHRKHRALDQLMNVMNVHFIRAEFDFKKGELNIYNSATKLSVIRNKQFRPWDAIYTSEELVATFPQSEWKSILFKSDSLLEESADLDSMNMVEEECPIYQNTRVYTEFFKEIKMKEVLSTMAFLISEDMIKEEKTIVMVPKRNKTTKKVKISETTEKQEVIQKINEEKMEAIKKEFMNKETTYKLKSKKPSSMKDKELLKQA